MICKYASVGCPMSSPSMDDVKAHESDAELHIQQLIHRVNHLESHNIILKNQNERLMGELLSSSSSSTSSRMRTLPSIPKTPLILPDVPTNFQYPLTLTCDHETPYIRVHRVQAYGENVPEVLVDSDAKPLQQYCGMSVPQVLNTSKSMLLMSLESDIPLTVDRLARTHIFILSSGSSTILPETHFLLSDCLLFPSVEEAVQAEMMSFGVYGFLGLCVKDQRALLVVRLRSGKRMISEDAVQFCVMTENRYDTSCAIAIGGRKYSKAGQIQEMIAQYKWSRQGDAVERTKLPETIVIGGKTSRALKRKKLLGST